MAGKPVSMITIKYSNKYYDHSDSSNNMFKAQISAFIGLWNEVTVEYYGDYLPNEEEQTNP
jgi:hypothetical protein